MTRGERPDVLVIGAGVIGCAVAHAAAREGWSVRLLERGGIAGEASGAAAGMLAPIAEADEPGPLLRWGRRSLERFEALAAELRETSGIDPEFELSGVLRVAEDEAAVAGLRARCDRIRDAGLEWWDADALRAAAPGLRPELAGALFSPREAHVRSPLLVRAFAAAAERRGARVDTGTPVRGLLREGRRVVGASTADERIHAGAVVLCTGSWARVCAEWLGGAAEVPITPVRGQIVAVEAPRPPLGTIVWGSGAYLVPKRDGSVIAGATVERVGFDRRVTASGVRRLLDAALALVPALGDAAFLEAWAGLRPDTPDHLPLVGPMPGAEGLVLAAGHFRNGVLLSPVTAELVAAGIAGKGWGEPAFLPERFWPGSDGDGG